MFYTSTRKMSAPLTVDDLRVLLIQFSIYDYVVFFGILTSCILFGIYFVFWRKENVQNGKDYFLGGKNFSCFPVAMSLIASFLNGLTILEASADTYLYGTELVFIFIPFLLNGLISSQLFLPVFHEMKVFSTYEVSFKVPLTYFSYNPQGCLPYLGRRFDSNVRLFGSLMYIVTQIFLLPIIIFVPALALNQVIGVNISIVMPFVCLIYIFYTFTGGLRGVIWIHTFQIWFVISSLVLATIKGSLDVGGFEEVWRRNYEGGRIILPNFDWDLTLRQGFWGLTLGGLINLIHDTIINQNLMQMYLFLPSLSRAKRASWIFVIGAVAAVLISCCTGLVLYATFRDCDPLTTKLINENVELLPLLGVKVLTEFPGLVGFFTFGILSSSLSSFSSGLNSISFVVLHDLIKPITGHEMGVRVTDLTLRGIVLIFGILLLTAITVVGKLEIVLRLPLSLASMTSGPMFGLFFSGMFLPWISSKGVLLGGILGLFGSSIVVIGAQNMISENKLKFIPIPTSVEGCLYYYNATAVLDLAQKSENGNVFPIFKLGFMWHTAFGGFITIILALIISALTGFTNPRRVDPICFSPLIRFIFPSKSRNYENKKLMK